VTVCPEKFNNLNSVGFIPSGFSKLPGMQMFCVLFPLPELLLELKGN
jgi:hypothetical protein